jgi:hypothetical protein
MTLVLYYPKFYGNAKMKYLQCSWFQFVRKKQFDIDAIVWEMFHLT